MNSIAPPERRPQRWLWLLIPAYPVASHGAILSGWPLPALLLTALGLAAAVILGRRRAWRAGLLACLPAVALLLCWWQGREEALLFLPPAFIYLLIGGLFAVTLRPGSIPLITRLAAQLRKRMSPAVVRYTRRVTAAWALLFVAQALESLLLARYASPETWSLFVNLLNYVFIALFFVGEYGLRIRLLPDEEHLDFGVYLRKLAALDLRRVVGRP